MMTYIDGKVGNADGDFADGGQLLKELMRAEASQDSDDETKK